MRSMEKTAARKTATKEGESSPLVGFGWLIAMGVLVAAVAVYLSAPKEPRLVMRFAK